MNLDSLFTTYDESLLLDMTRDILGFEVVWSTLGKEIFGNTLTTVANDMRNFTINFFNHSVVYTLLKKNHIMNHEMRRLYPQPDGPEFKLAAVLFLENTFSMKCAEADSSASPLDRYMPDGVLGRNAAGSILRDYGSLENIRLIFHQQSGFLVRQNQLGVHGRYKSPFQEMGIFSDKQLRYDKTAFESFLAVDAGLNQAATDTADQLLEILKSCDLSQDIPGYYKDLKSIQTPLPSIPYSKLQRIGETMFNLFGDYEVVKHFQNFWLEQLGICKNSISHRIFTFINSSDSFGGTPFDILTQNTIKKEKKVTQIREIEPWLSFCLYLFNGLIHSDSVSVEKVIEQLKLEDAINKITVNPQPIQFAEQNLFNARYASILKIKDLAVHHNHTTVIESLIDYQTQIMNNRGSSPMLRINDGVIKSIYPSSARFYRGKAYDPENYQHSYYIDALKQLVKGISS